MKAILHRKLGIAYIFLCKISGIAVWRQVTFGTFLGGLYGRLRTTQDRILVIYY